jgi:multidrug efflux pump subunit AcrA (membrane-fusion protein)
MKRHIENQLSDELRLIVCEPPNWVMRTGITVMSGIILLFFIATWIFKYPEVLKGNVTVSTQTPAIRVVSPATGRLTRLLVQEGAVVKKGDLLAETENTIQLENVPAMQQLLEQARAFLQQPKQTIAFPDDSYAWGGLQNDFNRLRQAYLDYQRLQSDQYPGLQIKNLQQQIRDLKEMAAFQQRQQQLLDQSVLNAQETFRVDEKLFQEGVISRIDFIKSKNKLLDKQSEQEDLHHALVQTSLKIRELEKSIQDQDYTFLEKGRVCLDLLEQSIHNIENSLRDWQQNYLIVAPADGKLVFLKNLSENQPLKALDTLFAVMPAQETFVASVEIPVQGMGKARTGQKVIIKLDDYPYQEFGMLEGVVQKVGPSSSIRYYRVDVALPGGLYSTYRQQLYCRAEMSGTAEIVTEDLRIIERAFYGLRKLLG